MSEFTKGLDPISASIVEHGGLFAYNRARLAGEVSPPAITTADAPDDPVREDPRRATSSSTRSAARSASRP